MLRGQLDALGAGHGSVVIVTGPAGVGKTTLLAEAVSLAAEGGILTFSGGGDVPYPMMDRPTRRASR